MLISRYAGPNVSPKTVETEKTAQASMYSIFPVKRGINVVYVVGQLKLCSMCLLYCSVLGSGFS